MARIGRSIPARALAARGVNAAQAVTAAMVDFTNRAETLRWLEAQPHEVSVAIAARAALRVLPLLDLARRRGPADFRSAIILPSFRASAVPWATAKYPDHGTELSATAVTANAAAYFAAVTNADAAAYSAAAAVISICSPAFAYAAHTAVAHAADAAFAVNSYAYPGANPDAADAYAAANADAAVIEAGINPDQRRLLAAELAGRSLWPGEAPPWAADAWSRLRTLLLEVNEDWDVWTEWYEDRLGGRASADPAIDLARALLPDALWQQGPKVVNGEIKRLIAAAREQRRLPAEAVSVSTGATAAVLAGGGGLFGGSADTPLALRGEGSLIAGDRIYTPTVTLADAPAHTPTGVSALAGEVSMETLPKQTAGVAIFVRHNSGVIDIAPPGPKDRLADTDDVRDFYSEVRDKTADLSGVGANMLGARLSKTVLTFADRTPENIADAVERRVWSSGNTLRSILAAHDKVADDRDPHPDKLDRGVAERLRDVVDTFNQLAVADSALRQRDASRPGPQEHDRSVRELKIAVEITAVAARDRSITTPQAGDELLEQIDAAKDAGSDVPGRLTVEQARDTSRNFFAEAMIGTYRFLRALPAAARGEGGFISKEYFSGIYKAAGAATYTAVLGAAASAYYITPEIINLFLSNAPTLKAYAALAFEHSPGFRQMIDWLELHVPNGQK